LVVLAKPCSLGNEIADVLVKLKKNLEVLVVALAKQCSLGSENADVLDKGEEEP
jgi:hypothetical protein